jgi:phenylalanyl-tRNA synthetase beta chain
MKLPPRDLKPAEFDPILGFKSRLRTILSAAGANEVLTYSFAHGSLMEKAGQNPKDAYQIANALSPDLQYYRLSLTPSLLEKVHPNIKAGFAEFALFEIGKGHNKLHRTDGEEKVPAEFQMLALTVASGQKSAKQNGAPFYAGRAIL